MGMEWVSITGEVEAVDVPWWGMVMWLVAGSDEGGLGTGMGGLCRELSLLLMGGGAGDT